MIKTSKRIYPDGKVPADFKNWLLKIKNVHVDEFQLKTSRIAYVGSYPFQKRVSYKARPIFILDVNNNRVQSTKLIRLT